MSKSDETQQLIANNNVLRKDLNPENAKYYDDLLVYVRTAGILYDDYEVESRLFEILQDILDAQKDGSTAKEYFGQHPNEVADQLISNFPKITPQKQLKFYGIIFGISAIWTLILQMNSQSRQLNLAPFLLNGIFLLFLIWGILWFIHQSVYPKLIQNKKLGLLSTWVVSIFSILIFTGIQFFKPEILSLTLTDGLVVTINALVIIAALITMFVIKKAWRPIVIACEPIIWVIALSNIFKLYAPTNMNKPILIWTAVLALISITWFFVWFWRDDHKESSEKATEKK